MRAITFALIATSAALTFTGCGAAEQTADNTGGADSETSTAGDDTGTPEPVYGLSTQTLQHDEETREYLLYVPESYEPTTPVPVMMSFHGFGGSANEQLQMVDMRALADAEGFILLYPQGTLLEGYSHWNTYLPGEDNKSEADDFGFVDAMLDVISAGYAIDTGRVYATGFSNGGDFTYTLACILSDRITGIAPVSGLMWMGTQRDCNLTHPTPMISFHGTADGDRPYEGWDGYLLSIEASHQYLAAHNNITASPAMTPLSDSGFTIERYDYEGGDAAITHYKVLNGAHTWFSFSDDGVETSSLIWRFLSQYDQDGLR
ncbi:MAG: PHB depolymerase family esterase [Myxococcota bacterium]|nr:PHB depolymerase family esterase [Myxococcota bacterium]